MQPLWLAIPGRSPCDPSLIAAYGMKFVDEAEIRVEAGRGGDGCLSFRRERFIPHGGPDGGDGGDGGSVYLTVDEGLNTLVDFRHARLYRAEHGRPGMGRQRSGRKGQDLVVKVPLGTMVYDADTMELIGDLASSDARLLVAKGGFHGLGNARFKTSTNRAPRRTSEGSAGEERNLRLELQLLADVGLAGLPNAGKSTLLRAVSAARPKVADYPFTTLYPSLGVVSTAPHRSFVMADIPGLVKGAAEGVGLGVRFLKHLNRSRLLLHLVDVQPPTDGSDPVADIQAVEAEIRKYCAELYVRERWLVLNKADLLPVDERERCKRAIVERLRWEHPVFLISALTGSGCRELMDRVQARLTEIDGRHETSRVQHGPRA